MVVKIEGEYYQLIEESRSSGSKEWQVDKHPDITVREVDQDLFAAFRRGDCLGRFHADDLTPLTIQHYS